MTIENWQEFLFPYEQAVDELLLKFKSIKKQTTDRGEISPIESISGRVKSISSILEKIDKYGIRTRDLEDEILDIAGIRIICQFVEDIYEVVNMVCERDGKDLTIVKVKNYMAGEDLSVLKSGAGQPKESGYQSYHIIIKYPVITSLGYKELNVEIQIRTLAMNFWAIIEHSLKYKYKEGLPGELQNRLVSMAEAVTDLDQEMSVIRDEILNAQQLFRMKSGTINDILDNIKILKKLNHEEKASEYENLFNALSDDQESIVRLFLLNREIQTEIGRIKGEA
ncbi:GTP pyrophosphokinase [Eubacterium barkeri]|uniref:Putative GTP pyrophosphokinase n=1 Tax=Eubacterium barkeri TaxID=1528 RepID=A0A1H3BMF9_EUBBA|nr:GTP pyrophosphokinase family protein [Eubacterium barkeri]SDX42975.1 putative GTP pyrophosphokinase [Eubacterium barkeri]